MNLQKYKQKMRETLDDLDVRLLIKHVLRCSDSDILVNGGIILNEEQLKTLEGLAARRVAGEPVSKIIGKKEFWDKSFIVSTEVLDPRPDSETIIEAALKSFENNQPDTIIDFGTGTGCLLLTLLSIWPNAKGIGVDISPNALKIATENAEKHNLSKRAEFTESDWDNSVDDSLRFDLILSNPPYIPESDIDSLAKDVKNFDPALALSGGESGLDAYEYLIPMLSRRLSSNGIAIFEIGIGQRSAVEGIVEKSGLTLCKIHRDLSGIDRVVEISLGKR